MQRGICYILIEKIVFPRCCFCDILFFDNGFTPSRCGSSTRCVWFGSISISDSFGMEICFWGTCYAIWASWVSLSRQGFVEVTQGNFFQLMIKTWCWIMANFHSKTGWTMKNNLSKNKDSLKFFHWFKYVFLKTDMEWRNVTNWFCR